LNNKNESKRAFLQFLPDFIEFSEFSENNISIVEVSSYENIEYQNLMKRKVEYYKNESFKSSGLYQFKVIDGKKLDIISDASEPNNWDGEELVQKGSFQGKKWSEIYEETLNWYNENTNGYFKDCALKELKRRNLIDDI
jgi:hypothetical protein